MTKRELIEVLATSNNTSVVKAEQFLSSLVKTVEDTVAQGGKVSISGFGVFHRANRAARRGVNPITGAEIHIPEMATPHFRAGTGFKKAVR